MRSAPTCAGLRNVRGLTLCDVALDTLLPDERPLLLTEGCAGRQAGKLFIWIKGGNRR